MSAALRVAEEVNTALELDDEVDEYLERIADRPDTLPHPRRPGQIENDHDLSRALERMRAADHEVRRLTDLAAARVAEIEEWLRRTAAPIERRRQYFETEARAYALQLLGDGKRVTRTVPEGRVTAKQPEPEYEVDRAELARQFIEMGIEEYVTREVRVVADWAAIKKQAQTPPGEPGQSVTPTFGGIALRGVTAKPRPPEANVDLQ